MCGRFLLTSPLEAVRAAFDLGPVETNLAPRYNIAPTQEIAVVRADADGGRALAFLRWGLVPSWMKEPPKGRPMINARAETVAERPAFRAAFRHRRCLVPADGWYEWRREAQGGKQPYLIRLREAAARPFAFAGIWERWQPPDGSPELMSVAILTRAAWPELATLHDRMPLVLAREGYARWLTGSPPAPREIAEPPGEAYEFYPVSRRVNRVALDAPELARPLVS
ncbi:MAG: SOS response-associated peptidase [Alphaproteobacteria bacterium]|nr:MAG: SOS response-associated peptidase [Alphaproteobacteria bacterium]